MNNRAKTYIEGLEQSQARPEADRLIPQGHELYSVALLTVGVSAELLRVRGRIRSLTQDLQEIYRQGSSGPRMPEFIDRLEELL